MIIEKIIRWWMVSKLPVEHIYIPKEKRPKDFSNLIRVYLRKWIIHPIKRRVAKYYLLLLKRLFNLKVIAITGSAGKTTTKEMIAAILSQKGNTVWSIKNIDPVYNIPSSILNCTPNTKYLVLEMGVEYKNEMDYYLWLAEPDIGVITNIYPTHTEFFENISGVAKEKSRLVKSMKKNDIAVLNINNRYTKQFARETSAKTIFFGKGSDNYATNVKITQNMNSKFTLHIGKSNISVQLALIGNHFIENALAASIVGDICGVSLKYIKKGLEKFKPEPHRMKVVIKKNIKIIDDSYNNNPKAAELTLKTFSIIAKDHKKVVVFGDMLELGKLERKYHKEIGKRIGNLGIDFLIGVGKASQDTVKEAKKILPKGSCFWVDNQRKVDKLLKPLFKGEIFVLIKGSRSIGLDNLVSRL